MRERKGGGKWVQGQRKKGERNGSVEESYGTGHGTTGGNHGQQRTHRAAAEGRKRNPEGQKADLRPPSTSAAGGPHAHPNRTTPPPPHTHTAKPWRRGKGRTGAHISPLPLRLRLPVHQGFMWRGFPAPSSRLRARGAASRSGSASACSCVARFYL